MSTKHRFNFWASKYILLKKQKERNKENAIRCFQLLVPPVFLALIPQPLPPCLEQKKRIKRESKEVKKNLPLLLDMHVDGNYIFVCIFVISPDGTIL